MLCDTGQNTVSGWCWACEEQSSFNYNRRMYTAHTGGAPWVPSLSNRGGCATGTYRAPTILGHSTKLGRCSSSTHNTGKLPKWGDKETWPKWKNRTAEINPKQNRYKEATRCRVQNTGYKDVSELRGRMDELGEIFSSIKNDIETIKQNQLQMKDILTEIKNNLQGINNRVDEAENKINDL